MVDTCQANTLFQHFYSPNIIPSGSSELDQSSYSHHADQDIGVAVIDRYTYYNLKYLEESVHNESSALTLGDLFDSYDEGDIHSRPGFRFDLFDGGEVAARRKLIVDFFGSRSDVQGSGREAVVGREELGATSEFGCSGFCVGPWLLLTLCSHCRFVVVGAVRGLASPCRIGG